MDVIYTAAAAAVFLVGCAAVLAVTKARAMARRLVAAALVVGLVAIGFSISAEVRERNCEARYKRAFEAWAARQPQNETLGEQLERQSDLDSPDPAPVGPGCVREPF